MAAKNGKEWVEKQIGNALAVIKENADRILAYHKELSALWDAGKVVDAEVWKSYARLIATAADTISLFADLLGRLDWEKVAGLVEFADKVGEFELPAEEPPVSLELDKARYIREIELLDAKIAELERKGAGRTGEIDELCREYTRKMKALAKMGQGDDLAERRKQAVGRLEFWTEMLDRAKKKLQNLIEAQRRGEQVDEEERRALEATIEEIKGVVDRTIGELEELADEEVKGKIPPAAGLEAKKQELLSELTDLLETIVQRKADLRRKKEKGEPITKEETAEIRRLHRQIAKIIAELDRLASQTG